MYQYVCDACATSVGAGAAAVVIRVAFDTGVAAVVTSGAVLDMGGWATASGGARPCLKPGPGCCFFGAALPPLIAPRVPSSDISVLIWGTVGPDYDRRPATGDVYHGGDRRRVSQIGSRSRYIQFGIGPNT